MADNSVFNKLDSVDIQVIKACLKYARVGMARSLAKSTSDNVQVALRKDVAAIDLVLSKIQ